MNVFATDHPLADQPAWSDATKRQWRSYFLTILIAGLILSLVFIGILWFVSTDSLEEIPAVLVNESVYAVIGFLMFFPVFFVTQTDFIYAGTVLDAFFWAFVSVTLVRVVAWGGS
jgi:hypothetical protein